MNMKGIYINDNITIYKSTNPLYIKIYSDPYTTRQKLLDHDYALLNFQCILDAVNKSKLGTLNYHYYYSLSLLIIYNRN